MPQAQADVPPNVLIVTTHDSGDYFGCYGTPVSTPHIDALAAEGVVFERHFTTATVCSPSRGSIVTGCYPSTTGLTRNIHRGHEGDLRTYPHLAARFADQGYETHLFGLQHEHWDPSALGYQHVHTGESRHTVHVEPLVRDWLRGQAGAHQPFLAAVGCIETHRMGMNPSHFQRPEYRPADPAQVEVRPFLPDIPPVRGELADLYGALGAVDDMMGQILSALEDAGLRDRTLVVFTTDHGASLLHSKSTLYDGGTKVGLVMRYPGVLPAGRRVDSLTSHVDILPSVCELLGWPAPQGIDGQSFAPLAQGQAAARREYVFGERPGSRMIRSHEFKYIRHMTSTCLFNSGMREVELCPAGVWKNQEVFDHYAVRRVREELYDLRADPAELDNRIDDPAYREALDELRAALDVHLEAIGGALEHVDVAADGPEWGWKGVREAQRRGDPNLRAVIALGE